MVAKLNRIIAFGGGYQHYLDSRRLSHSRELDPSFRVIGVTNSFFYEQMRLVPCRPAY